MKVIKPNSITPSSIVSSTLVETEQPWSSTTNYSVGDVVYYNYDGIYQAITGNTNKIPSENPLDWAYIKPVNRWALFDPQISTVSSAQDIIELTIPTGDMQGLAVLNMLGNNVAIEVRNGQGGDIIYSGSQSLIGEVLDWYQYFFFDMENQRNQAIFIDLPLNYIDTYTKITITGVGNVYVGTVTFGRLITLGKTEFGATSRITDYSVKETDEFGETTFVRRAYSKRLTARVLIDNAELNRTQRALYNLRAQPALWFGSENPTMEEALIVFGYYRDFSTDISYPSYSYCSLEIEGLI